MDAGIQTTSLPSSVAEFGNIKGAAQEPITFNKNVVRVTYSIDPDKPKAVYTNGENIEFSLKTYDAQYINFVKSYLICDVKYIDPWSNYDVLPAALTEVICDNRYHLCAPLHGSHSFFKKMTIKVGSRVLQEKDNCDLINDVQMTLSAKDAIYDEPCGYYNPDSMWADPADPFKEATECLVPLESLIDDIPYLAEYNLHKPISIRLEVNSSARMFGPCISPQRIQLLNAAVAPTDVGAANDVSITPKVAGDKPTIEISNIRFVIEGLRTTDQSNLDLVPQEWHSLISDSGVVSDALGFAKVDITLPIQKSSIKYIAMVKVPTEATSKVYPTGFAFTASKSSGSNSPLKDVVCDVLNRDSTSCNMDAWASWDIKKIFYKIAGRHWPTDFAFESSKQIYMEIQKEFHNYSMQGTSDAPMIKEHTIIREPDLYALEDHINQTSPDLKTGDLVANAVNTFSGYMGSYVTSAGISALATMHPQKQVIFTSFSKFIEQGKSIIGALDSESRNIIVKTETNAQLLSVGNYNHHGVTNKNAVACQIYYVVWYDSIVKLDSEIGAIDIFL